VAELLEYLTRELGVEIPEEDLFSDEFSSIEGIASIIRRLRGSNSP
jgi:acyl carrier protein